MLFRALAAVEYIEFYACVSSSDSPSQGRPLRSLQIHCCEDQKSEKRCRERLHPLRLPPSSSPYADATAMAKRGADKQINNLMSERELESMGDEPTGTWEKADDVRSPRARTAARASCPARQRILLFRHHSLTFSNFSFASSCSRSSRSANSAKSSGPRAKLAVTRPPPRRRRRATRSQPSR